MFKKFDEAKQAAEETDKPNCTPQRTVYVHAYMCIMCVHAHAHMGITPPASHTGKKRVSGWQQVLRGGCEAQGHAEPLTEDGDLAEELLVHLAFSQCAALFGRKRKHRK